MQRLLPSKLTEGSSVMRSVLLWLVGIPIPVIILLYVFKVF